MPASNLRMLSGTLYWDAPQEADITQINADFALMPDFSDLTGGIQLTEPLVFVPNSIVIWFPGVIDPERTSLILGAWPTVAGSGGQLPSVIYCRIADQINNGNSAWQFSPTLILHLQDFQGQPDGIAKLALFAGIGIGAYYLYNNIKVVK